MIYNGLIYYICILATGLHIRVKGEEARTFSYQWAPLTSTACRIKWRPLVNHEVTYLHIRCHKLQAKDDLPSLMSSMDSAPCTQALLLINTDNSYQINPKFYPSEEKSIFPVIVVTAETGLVLLEALSKSEVQVKVDLPDTADIAQLKDTVQSSGLLLKFCI